MGEGENDSGGAKGECSAKKERSFYFFVSSLFGI